MEKKSGLWLVMFLLTLVWACTDLYVPDDHTGEDEVIPAVGDTYTPQGKYNLNVVYYVPADMEPWEDWHYRLSGVTLHAQEFFRQSMKRYMIDKTFHLLVNEVPQYVKIHYIKSKRLYANMQEKDLPEMADEVLEYFEKNPGEKSSNHYLIYMPKYEGAFYTHYYPSSDQGMAFCGCDYDKFNIKYMDSARARAHFLGGLGNVLHELGHALFLTENSQAKSDAYLGIMGWYEYISSGFLTQIMLPRYYHEKYTGSYSGSSFTAGIPDKLRLTETDVMCLKGNQVFDDNWTGTPFSIDIKQIDLSSVVTPESWEKDTVFVDCRFASEAEIEGAILYIDPWRTYVGESTVPAPELDKDENYESGGDAYGLYVDKRDIKHTDGLYEINFVLPMSKLLAYYKPFLSKEDAELRFRFIAKGGALYPNPTVSIKGPDAYRHKFTIEKKAANELYMEAVMNWMTGEPAEKLMAGLLTEEEFYALQPQEEDFIDQVVQTVGKKWKGLK